MFSGKTLPLPIMRGGTKIVPHFVIWGVMLIPTSYRMMR